MSNRDMMTAAVAVLFASLIALWIAWPQPKTSDKDGPGPNLMIEVGGAIGGVIIIDLKDDLAPTAVARVIQLVEDGAYDGVAFHRVLGGAMAQTGDVEFGNVAGDTSNAGYGTSKYVDLPDELSVVPFVRGVVGMYRSGGVDSANSQFFITLQDTPELTGQHTVIGEVVAGMEIVDKIKTGDPNNDGLVERPDYMAQVWIDD